VRETPEVSLIEFDLQQLRVVFLVLLGLMLLTLAILMIYLLLAGRHTRRRAGQQGSQDELDKWTQPRLPAPAGQIAALYREAPGRGLQVEVGGARYERLAEIEDPHLKRQVVEAAMDLVRFTGVLGVEPIAPAPVDKTYSWREDLRAEIRAQGQPTPPRPSSGDLEEQFLNLLSEIGPAPPAEKVTLGAAIRQRWAAKPAQQEEPYSVVNEIETIVQRRLPLISALAGRELHVRQGADGTVRFLFEGHDYEKLDEIPNLTARQLVKDAIQEWDEMT
jgi:hypothetical protein